MERDSGSPMSGTLINVGWQANDGEQIIKLLWSCFFLWANEKSWVESHQLREVSLSVEILSYRSWMEGSGWHHLSNLSITQSRAVRHFWPLKWHDTMYVTLPEKSSCQKIGQSCSQAPGPTHQLSGNNGIEEHVEGCQGSENTAKSTGSNSAECQLGDSREMGGGDGSATAWTYLMPLNCSHKYRWNSKFCHFYFTTTKSSQASEINAGVVTGE